MAIAFLTTAASSYATDTGYGASAATAAIKTGQAFTIVDMLRWAAEDEYLAHGEYAAIMKKFGAMRPYDNIMAAEEQHLAWLKEEFRIRGLPFPSDGSASAIVVPSDLKAAAQAGVDAEIANIAMYAAFLARPELSRPEYASVKDLFERLMRASENHLKAFRNQLSKY
ncbi:MAG: hypothetical protein CVV47_09865 [Spirochaetae bacterium HGW-Spirochaetae-3]|jgi:hypothetical protein|nr:MAG: hypothetical protein CVV47_09865 [Spirochaetae bacterium HGW-Spirochaetae-3]